MYAHILLPIDLTEEASWKKALPVAVEYCQAFGSTLHLMTVVPGLDWPSVAQYFPEDFEAKAVEQATKELQAFSSKQVPAGVKVEQLAAYGTIYEEILQAAKRIKADLIVMASHRPALRDYLLGPNAARVVRHADRSVLVVRE